MESDNPLVSVVIPSFNREEFINDTILSLQQQSYFNWEAIIVDDCSTDNTEQVVSAFIRGEPRARFLKRNRIPKGAPTCRNIGWIESKGDYVIFLDSDDLLAPYCLEQRVKFLRDNPDLDFAVFPMLVFKETPGDSNIFWNIQTDKDDLHRFLDFDAPWQTSCPIWKIEALRAISGWDEEALTWQDWEIHIKALVNQLKYKKSNSLPDCFLRRDEKEGRISSGDNADSRFMSRIKTFNKTYLIVKEKQLLDDKMKALFAKLYFTNAEKAALLGKSSVVYSFVEAIQERNLSMGLMITYVKLLLAISKSKIPFALSIAYKTLRTILPISLTQIQSNLFKHELKPEEQKRVLALLKD
ncbi:glycosyltransferase family A protein [Nibribacter koreensis]|uniref:Glycosyltransferase 2-like domain-containing protein n=1 Tax=Nibribacter koreensis TaxID=1084519 RepID=A0ABP8FH40_9BACT